MSRPRNLLAQTTIEDALHKDHQASAVCGRCIIPDGFRSHALDERNLCTYCANDTLTGRKRVVSDEQRTELREAFDRKLAACKETKGLYDVAVGFSGGKDSTYLIWKLQQEYGLRVLGVVIDHSFFPDVVARNIAEIAGKLKLDTHYCHVDESLMEKFFKRKFARHAQEREKPLFDLVCGECSDIIEGNVMKVAANFGIPLVMIGLSPEQTNRYFFQLDQEHIRKAWLDEFFSGPEITESEKRFQWNPRSDEEKNLEVCIPFHVWDYDATGISAELERLGILSQSESDPLRTECKVLHTIRFIDHQNLGFDPRIGPFSDLVRMGRADRDGMIEKFYSFKYDKEILEEVHSRLDLFR